MLCNTWSTFPNVTFSHEKVILLKIRKTEQIFTAIFPNTPDFQSYVNKTEIQCANFPFPGNNLETSLICSGH